MHSRIGRYVLVALLSLWTSAIEAQEAATVVGVVRGPVGSPLVGAQIELVKHRVLATTGDGGRYQLHSTKTGPHIVVARAIGYRPQYRSVTLGRGTVDTLDLTLEAIPQDLPELEVIAEGQLFATRTAALRQRLRSSGYSGRLLGRDQLQPFGRVALAEAVFPLLPGTTRRQVGTPCDGVAPGDGRNGSVDLGAIQPAARAGDWLTTYEVPASGIQTNSGTQLVSGFFEPGYGNSLTPFIHRTLATEGCGPWVAENGGRPIPGRSLESYGADEVEAVEVYRTSPVGRLVMVWTRQRTGAND